MLAKLILKLSALAINHGNTHMQKFIAKPHSSIREQLAKVDHPCRGSTGNAGLNFPLFVLNFYKMLDNFFVIEL